MATDTNRQPPVEGDDNFHGEEDHERPALYILVTLVWLAALVAIGYFYCYMQWDTDQRPYAIATAAVLAAWFGVSLWSVPFAFYAAIDFFGMQTKTFDPGLKLVPWGIFKRYLISAETFEDSLPAPRDRIDYDDDKQEPSAGYSRPWRFLTGGPTAGPESDELLLLNEKGAIVGIRPDKLLEVQMYVTTSAFVAWSVYRHRLFTFLRASNNDPDQVRIQLLEVGYQALAEELSKDTVAGINRRYGEIKNAFFDTLRRRMFDLFGINIVLTAVNPLITSHDHATALKNAANALPNAFGARVEADTARYVVMQELMALGMGAADAAKKVENLTSEQLLAAYVLQNTVAPTDKMIFGVNSLTDILPPALVNVLKDKTNTGEEK